MADTDITMALDDEIAATTLDELRPTVYNQVMMQSVLMREFETTPWKEERAGGYRIRTPLRTGRNTSFATFGKGTPMTPAPYPLMMHNYWNFKQGAGDVLVDWVTEREIAGGGSVIDLIGERTAALIDGVREEMNSMLWASLPGNHGMDFNGLQLLIPADPRTGLLAGLNRADHYWWRNNYWANDANANNRRQHPIDADIGTPVAGSYFGDISDQDSPVLDIMGTMLNNASVGSNLSDYFIITTQLIYEAYLKCAQYLKNVTINFQRGDDTFAWNFGNAIFRGVPIRFDSENAPAGEMRIINKQDMKLISDSGAWFVWSAERKPYDQFCTVRYLMLRGQLVIGTPRKHAVLHGLLDWEA